MSNLNQSQVHPFVRAYLQKFYPGQAEGICQSGQAHPGTQFQFGTVWVTIPDLRTLTHMFGGSAQAPEPVKKDMSAGQIALAVMAVIFLGASFLMFAFVSAPVLGEWGKFLAMLLVSAAFLGGGLASRRMNRRLSWILLPIGMVLFYITIAAGAMSFSLYPLWACMLLLAVWACIMAFGSYQNEMPLLSFSCVGNVGVFVTLWCGLAMAVQVYGQNPPDAVFIQAPEVPVGCGLAVCSVLLSWAVSVLVFVLSDNRFVGKEYGHRVLQRPLSFSVCTCLALYVLLSYWDRLCRITDDPWLPGVLWLVCVLGSLLLFGMTVNDLKHTDDSAACIVMAFYIAFGMAATLKLVSSGQLPDWGAGTVVLSWLLILFWIQELYGDWSGKARMQRTFVYLFTAVSCISFVEIMDDEMEMVSQLSLIILAFVLLISIFTCGLKKNLKCHVYGSMFLLFFLPKGYGAIPSIVSLFTVLAFGWFLYQVIWEQILNKSVRSCMYICWMAAFMAGTYHLVTEVGEAFGFSSGFPEDLVTSSWLVLSLVVAVCASPVLSRYPVKDPDGVRVLMHYEPGLVWPAWFVNGFLSAYTYLALFALWIGSLGWFGSSVAKPWHESGIPGLILIGVGIMSVLWCTYLTHKCGRCSAWVVIYSTVKMLMFLQIGLACMQVGGWGFSMAGMLVGSILLYQGL